MSAVTKQTAAAPAMAPVEIEGDRNIIDRTVEEYDRDPRIVRQGYNPGMRNVNIMNRYAGLKEPLIPVGVFWEITSFNTPQELFTTDENKPKDTMGMVYAADAEQVQRDVLDKVGYQSLLFGMEDRAMVKVINRTLIPTLTEIRELFEGDSPIPAICPAEDELDMGIKRDHCAMCHLEWIKSTACEAYMQQVAAEGMPVRIRTTEGKIQSFALRPSIDILETTRASVQRGLEVYIKHASESWSTVLSELENKTRNQLFYDEHLMRKDIHEYKPKDAGLNQIASFASLVSEGMNSGRPTGGDGDTSAALLAFIERQDARAEQAQQESRDFMMMIADKIGGEASAAKPVKTKESEKSAAAPE